MNPLFPLSFLGSQIARSDAEPWLDGETVGTVVSAARVGDLLFVAIPGEGYPAIQFTLERAGRCRASTSCSASPTTSSAT